MHLHVKYYFLNMNVAKIIACTLHSFVFVYRLKPMLRQTKDVDKLNATSHDQADNDPNTSFGH